MNYSYILSPFLLSLLLLFSLILTPTLTNARVIVEPRDCEGHIKHVTMSVGHQSAATSRILTLASKLSHQKQPKVAVVYYGTQVFALEHRVEQSNVSSYALENVAPRGNVHDKDYYSPYYHHIYLNDLQPDTQYYYRLALENSRQTDHSSNNKNKNNNNNPKDNNHHLRRRRLMRYGPYIPLNRACPDPHKVRSFRTAPANPFASNRPVQLAIVGDLGQFPHSQDTVDHLVKQSSIDLVVLAGDVAYTNEDHRRWDTFFDFLDDAGGFFARVPLQLVPGNHDIDMIEDRHEIFLAYEHRFRMPAVQPAQLGVYQGTLTKLNMDVPPYPLPYDWGNAYYAVTLPGAAQLLFLSAYASMEPESTQYTWIEAQLQQIDRTKTPWVLAVIHVPLYNTFSLHHHDLQIAAARQHLEPLLADYQVNLVFSGHIHAYQRTHPVYDSTVNTSAPVHLMVGAGGRKCEAPYTQVTPEDWLAFRDATRFGYGTLRLLDERRAVWSWIPTGHAEDDRHVNPVGRTNVTVAPMGVQDDVWLENQYFTTKGDVE